MTVRPLTRDEVRSIDRRAVEHCRLSTLLLMENAGRGAAQYLRELAPGQPRVLVVCGTGNNGGDGGVVARHLDSWGFKTRVTWFGEHGKLAPDAAFQYSALEASGFDQRIVPGEPAEATLDALCSEADWIVDGLLGTGLTRAVSGPLARVIASVNRSGKPVLALDLPSGLDADSGQPLGQAVKAVATATFVAPKLGLTLPGASHYAGVIRVIEIGVPLCLLNPFLVP